MRPQRGEGSATDRAEEVLPTHETRCSGHRCACKLPIIPAITTPPCRQGPAYCDGKSIHYHNYTPREPKKKDRSRAFVEQAQPRNVKRIERSAYLCLKTMASCPNTGPHWHQVPNYTPPSLVVVGCESNALDEEDVGDDAFLPGERERKHAPEEPDLEWCHDGGSFYSCLDTFAHDELSEGDSSSNMGDTDREDRQDEHDTQDLASDADTVYSDEGAFERVHEACQEPFDTDLARGLIKMFVERELKRSARLGRKPAPNPAAVEESDTPPTSVVVRPIAPVVRAIEGGTPVVMGGIIVGGGGILGDMGMPNRPTALMRENMDRQVVVALYSNMVSGQKDAGIMDKCKGFVVNTAYGISPFHVKERRDLPDIHCTFLPWSVGDRAGTMELHRGAFRRIFDSSDNDDARTRCGVREFHDYLLAAGFRSFAYRDINTGLAEHIIHCTSPQGLLLQSTRVLTGNPGAQQVGGTLRGRIEVVAREYVDHDRLRRISVTVVDDTISWCMQQFLARAMRNETACPLFMSIQPPFRREGWLAEPIGARVLLRYTLLSALACYPIFGFRRENSRSLLGMSLWIGGGLLSRLWSVLPGLMGFTRLGTGTVLHITDAFMRTLTPT